MNREKWGNPPTNALCSLGSQNDKTIFACLSDCDVIIFYPTK